MLEEDKMEMIVWESAPHSVATFAHTHPEIELLYILDGRFIATADGQQYPLEPGDLILFRANAIHHVITLDEPTNRYYCVKMKTTLLQSLSGRANAADYTVRLASDRAGTQCLWKRAALDGTEAAYHMTRLAEEFEGQGYGAEIAMKCHAVALILALLRACRAEGDTAVGDAMSERDSQLITYIRRHFTEELDVHTLAARYGVSYGYFSRWFKCTAGMPFKSYLNLLRINFAEQLLLTTSSSVTEVAGACGYNNVSYFIDLYRRQKGETPKQTAKRGIGYLL